MMSEKYHVFDFFDFRVMNQRPAGEFSLSPEPEDVFDVAVLLDQLLRSHDANLPLHSQ